MSISYDDSDLFRLTLKMKRLGKVPQRCVTKAAKKGASIILRAARKLAPKDTGNLKRGLKLVGEKHRKKGKKVYQVAFAANMTDIFRKSIKEPGKYGGKKSTGYYPASMEFGFLSGKSSTSMSYRMRRMYLKSPAYGKSYFRIVKVPGKHFMRDAASENDKKAKELMIEVLEKEIDKEWAKK